MTRTQEITDEFVRETAAPVANAESFVHVDMDDQYHPAGGYWFPCGETYDDSTSGWVESISELPDGEVIQYPRDSDRDPIVLGSDDVPAWVVNRVIAGGRN